MKPLAITSEQPPAPDDNQFSIDLSGRDIKWVSNIWASSQTVLENAQMRMWMYL